MLETAAPGARQTCFVDMPFGKKVDPKSGVEIDFDQVFKEGIEPAVAQVGLECIRGDREQTGGIIHTAMFARLLASEYVIADMTSANPNVFYELGVRHAAKPYTTIPMFATLGAPPFDVNMVRAIPYELAGGVLAPAAAAALVEALGARLRAAQQSPVANDSPLFQLLAGFPGIAMDPAMLDVFRDRVASAGQLGARLAAARAAPTLADARKAVAAIQGELGNIATVERGVLMDLLLAWRAVEGYDEMVSLVGAMSGPIADTPVVCQQLAFALNRRNQPGDRDRAVGLLEALRRSHGDSGETLGLLGRVYKDRFREARKAANAATTAPAKAAALGLADGWLDLAIDAYLLGFKAEPLEFFPGINALTLLFQKGDKPELRRWMPLVVFAVERRGGAKSPDYWCVATLLEAACIEADSAPDAVAPLVPRVLALGTQAWQLKTTRENLEIIASCHAGDAARLVQEVVAKLEAMETAVRAPAA